MQLYFVFQLELFSNLDELPISSEERKAVRRFCLPRMSLLYLVAEFLTNATARVKEIRYLIRRKISFPEIIVEHGQVSVSGYSNVYNCLDTFLIDASLHSIRRLTIFKNDVIISEPS